MASTTAKMANQASSDQAVAEVAPGSTTRDVEVRTITRNSTISVADTRPVSRVDNEPMMKPIAGLPSWPGARESVDPLIAHFVLCEINGAPADHDQPFSGVGSGKLNNGCTFSHPTEIVGGRLHGKGEMRWPDGVEYKGQFSANQVTGKRTYRWPDGTSYTGDVRDGKRTGKGKFDSGEGVSFEGQWQDGTKHGTGKMCYGVGRGEYDGEWANDQRSGLGVMTYHSGNVYTGGWAADVRHGSGKMLWVVANEEYSGNWSLGSMHGEGSYYWLDSGKTVDNQGKPNLYIGQFKNGQMHGQGKFAFSTGATYQGNYDAGEKHGEGKFKSEKARLPKDGNFVYNRYYDAVTGELVLAPRDDKRQLAKPLDLGGIVGRHASASTARKITDLLHRMRFDINAIFRFYAALGTTRVEEMYSMTGSQWIRLCKDILIISEQMPSSVLSAMHSEVCANAHTHALMLKDFYILAVQVAVKLYPMAPGEYECVDKLLTEALLPNAQTDPDATNQAFRELLYKPSVQAVWHEAGTITLGLHLPHKPAIIYIILVVWEMY